MKTHCIFKPWSIFPCFSIFPWKEKHAMPEVSNLRKRVSIVLDEEENDLVVGEVSLSDRGSSKHQVNYIFYSTAINYSSY